MPPVYAKAYVRRQKNDAADAAGVSEAVTGTTRCTVGASERGTVIGTQGQRTTSGPAGKCPAPTGRTHDQAGHMIAPDQVASAA
jgi:hypothetical protein